MSELTHGSYDAKQSRTIQPPLTEHARLRQKLTPGEQIVLELFDRTLAPEWEIYVQPHLNGLRPDFVLLNPEVGIAVFEVKDWNLDALTYFYKETGFGQRELWGRKDGQEFSLERQNPFSTIRRYKNQIFNLYCPRLQKNGGFAAIMGGVIFPFADTDRVRMLQSVFLSADEAKTAPTYFPVSGRADLTENNIAAIFPESARKTSNIMTAALASDLRGWLVEPDFATKQRRALPLDKVQRALVDTRTKTGFRRIKGPAGSGKSLVLAARAAKLCSEGKTVLIVTFNITLWHYLRDFVVRGITRRGAMENIVFTHFHDWCKETCLFAGMGEPYYKLVKMLREIEESNKSADSKEKHINHILNIELPELAARAAQSAPIPQYDAVLVDEGQDYLPLWWNTLRHCRQPEGEMVLVADSTQDIFGKARSWTNDAWSGAGFSGDWARLTIGYRLPQEAQNIVHDFAIRFLPKDLTDLSDVRQVEGDLEPCTLKWIQSESENDLKACVDAILAMMRQTGKNGIANADITFICNDISFGTRVVAELETYRIRTVNTYEIDRREQRRRKMGFFMGDAKVKATTLHSFKGWETRLPVIHVGHAFGEEGMAAIYAGLTRLKRSPEGSWLTVVSSAPEVAAFGRQWPDWQQAKGSDHAQLLEAAGTPYGHPRLTDQASQAGQT